jgi:hypothetical protein
LLFLSADGRASENDWCSLPPSCFCLKGHCFPCLFSHCYPLAFAHGQSVGPNLVAHFKSLGWALLAYACNPSYLGGWDWENRGSRPAWANSPWDPISKITREKWTGGVAHVVGCLLLNHKVMHSNPSPTKKKKKKRRSLWGTLANVDTQSYSGKPSCFEIFRAPGDGIVKQCWGPLQWCSMNAFN